MTLSLTTLTAAMTSAAGMTASGQQDLEASSFTLDDFADAIETRSASSFSSHGGHRRLEAALETKEGRQALEPVIGLAVDRGVENATDSTGWATTRPVANFQRQERDGLASLGRLKLLPRDGEVNHTSVQSRNQSAYIPHRFARGLGFDAQDLIDDVYEVLNDVPARFGAEAVATRVDLVYAELMTGLAGSTPFFVDDVNSFNVAMSADGLSDLIGKMTIQTENGDVIDSRPTHLIVGATNEGKARQALRALEVGGQAPLKLTVEPRLDVGCVDPRTDSKVDGSANEFYLAASQLPGLEVGLVSPRPRVRLTSPHLQTFISGHSNQHGSMGIIVEIDHGFGGALCDPRGIFRGVMA